MEDPRTGLKNRPKRNGKGQRKLMALKKPELECSEDDCPFHGSLAVRGRTLEGTVVSTRMQKSCVVQLNYTRYNNKYERYSRMRSRITAHSTPSAPASSQPRNATSAAMAPSSDTDCSKLLSL